MCVYFNSNPFLSAKPSKTGGKTFRCLSKCACNGASRHNRKWNENEISLHKSSGCNRLHPLSTDCILCVEYTKIPLLTSEWPQATSVLLGWHVQLKQHYCSFIFNFPYTQYSFAPLHSNLLLKNFFDRLNVFPGASMHSFI